MRSKGLVSRIFVLIQYNFKALRELIIDEKEDLNNSMSDFVALEDLSSKLGHFEKECLELKR